MFPKIQKEKIQTHLLQWFKNNGRKLPWRETCDPYAIWVSEIMLQQTQISTVIPYYQRFLKTFPTVKDLARANLSKVLKVWEGLGYYSRARNLHQASRVIAKDFHRKIPDNPKDLLGLPGIGRYTAGAILSIAFDKKAAILDGNVKRVLSRLFAIWGNSGERKTEEFLWQTSESLVPEKHPGAFNQALMDLGSMICVPKGPQCLRCPIQRFCKGKASGDPERYPSRKIRKPIPHIEALSAVIVKDGKVLLKRRVAKGLLGGLWEFPNWKIEGKRKFRMGLKIRNHIKKEMGMDVEVREPLGIFQQTFSHFKLALHVYFCKATNDVGQARWVSVPKLNLFPMSRIHRRIADLLVRSSES